MIISISGEVGAGCTEVGQIVSKKLGYQCVSSADLIKKIVVDFRGVHPRESFSEFEQHVKSGEVDLDMMLDSKIDEVLETGEVVVEGRSALMLLDNENVLKVLLVAPHDKRVQRVAERRNITVEDAEEVVRISDSERSNMVKKLFAREWLDPHNYDIVINTGLRVFEDSAEIILRALAYKNDAV